MNELITKGAEIKQRVISEIKTAKKSIYVAMAWFTDRDIASAIVEAKNKGVDIDVILSSNAQNDNVKSILRNAGVSVHAFNTGDARGIMHHKFCLIDGRISINGSYNYTFNASNNNVENIQISDDISTYSQFVEEFERLKYNIEQNVGVSQESQATENNMQNFQATSIVDDFSRQLHNLVYSATQVDINKYKDNGYKTSKESQGNMDIFRAEYNGIKEKVSAYATDEGLGSVKSTLSSNVSIAFESVKKAIELEKEEKIEFERRKNELEHRQVLDKILELKDAKSMLELGSKSTGEKGLLQINNEIEKSKLERRLLDQSLIIKKFWTVGNAFILFVLIIFVFYLSIFFASAVYKVFFEGNVIRASLEAGVNPGVPQIVDANAIVKIYKEQGILFGLIAVFFFLIPILLSNLKIIGSRNKLVNTIFFWVGLLVFDIIVSTMIAINTDEIKSLLVGQNSTLKIWQVVNHGEFWLIFVFGMFPLIITHYLIDNISSAYKASQKDSVDAEKNRNIRFLDMEIMDLNTNKALVLSKIQEKTDMIDEENKKAYDMQTSANSVYNQIDGKFNDAQKQIKAIHDDFNTRIKSGRVFTDVILSSIVSAYKLGFI